MTVSKIDTLSYIFLRVFSCLFIGFCIYRLLDVNVCHSFDIQNGYYPGTGVSRGETWYVIVALCVLAGVLQYVPARWNQRRVIPDFFSCCCGIAFAYLYIPLF